MKDSRKTKVQFIDELEALRTRVAELEEHDTAGKQAEQALPSLLQQIRAGVVVHDADTRIIESNAVAQELLGLTEAQMRGKDSADPAWNFLRADGTPMPREEYPVNRVLSTRPPLHDSVGGIVRPGSDDVVWVLVSAVPVFADNGSVSQVIVTFMDITERKRVEEALRKAHEGLESRVAERTAELMAANKELRKSEERYRSLVDNAPNMIMTLDRDGLIQSINHTVPGLSAEDVIGKDHLDFVDPEYRDEVRRTIEKVIKTGKPDTYRTKGAGPDGSLSWYETSVGPLLDDDAVVGATLIISDISDRKRLEELSQDFMRTQEDLLSHVSRELHDDVGQLLCAMDLHLAAARNVEKSGEGSLRGDLKDIHDLIHLTVDSVRTLCQRLRTPVIDDVGLVALMRSHIDGFRSRAGIEVEFICSTDEEGIDPKMGLGFFRIMQEALTNVRRHANATRVEVALRREAQRLVLEVSDNGQGFSPGAEEPGVGYGIRNMQERARLFAGSLGIESKPGHGTRVRISSPSKQDELVHDITGRKRTEDELQATNERLKYLLESTSVAIYTAEPFGDCATTSITENVEQMVGYRSREFLEDPRFWIDHVHPEDAPRLLEGVTRLFDRGTHEFEYRFLHKDGTYRWVRDEMNVVRDATGNPVEIVGYWMNITERKRREEALEEAEEKYRSIFETVPASVIVLDRDGQMVDISPYHVVHIGRGQTTKEDYVGKNIVTHPSIVNAGLSEVYRRVLQGEPFDQRDVYFPTLTRGTDGYFNVKGAPLFKDDEVIGAVVTHEDITELKRAERAIRDSEVKHRTLVRNLAGMVYRGQQDWSAEIISGCEEICGYTVNELRSLPEKWVGIIHPDDKERVLREGSELAKTRGHIVQTYRIVTKGGDTRWVEDRKTALFSENGEFVGIDGVAFDITERKSAQRELEESLEHTKTHEKEVLALLNGARAVMECDGFEEAARSIFDTCRDLTGAVSGYVALLSADGAENEVLFLESGGLPCDADPALPMPIRGLRSEAYRDGKAVYDNEFPRSQWMEFMPEGHVGLENVLFAPLIIAGKVVGLIGLANKPGGFTEDDARMATAFGELAAIALRNSRDREALEESEKRYRGVVEDQTELICRWDPDGTLTFVNNAYCCYFGKKREELVGYSFIPLIPEEDHERVKKHVGSLNRENPIMTHEHRVIGPSGDVCWMQWTNRLILDNAGQVIESQSVGRDITEYRRLQQQLLQVQKLEGISTLSAGVAHNFNNILTAILGNLELAKRGGGSGRDVQEYLERATKAGDRAAQLTRQLLKFSRRESGERTSVSVSELVDSVSQTLGVLLDSNIEVRCSIADDASHIMANYAEIEQVLMNICLNAQDAMPKGGLLAIRADAVGLSPEYCQVRGDMDAGDYVKISISDTGVGMDDEMLSQIFDPFFTTKDPDRGTGLGLSAAYQTLATHGGCVEVESEVGRGTKFTIYLPAAEKPEEDVASQETTELIKGSETVLVVDDEEMVLDTLRESLDSLGYTVLTAENGKDAIEVYRRERNRIDLVLLDYMMPVMDGESTYYELRKINPDVKVLVASGYDNKSKVKPLLDAGTNGFVQKPFDLFELSKAVRDALDRQQQPAAHRA